MSENNNTKHFIILLFIMFCVFKNAAQQSETFSNIQYITSDDGLSQSEVTSILQDKKGFLWIGTRGGLNRYNGNSIKVFQNEIENSNSLINNSIETLFEDSKGNIWIGTKSNGVSYYNPEFNRFNQFQSSFSKESTRSLLDKRIVSIAESLDNNIWIGTWRNGLYIFNPENETFNHLLSNKKVNHIKKASNGEMWITTSKSVFVYSSKGERLERITFDNKTVEFTSVIEDIKTGLFYFGTWKEGLLEYNLKTKTFKQYKICGSLNLNNAYYLSQDKEGYIWIGYWGNGVNRFNPSTKIFKKFDLSSGQNKGGTELYQDVLCVYQDKSESLWFGTNGGGVCKVDEKTGQLGEIKKTDLPSEPIWAIAKDKADYLWVGIKGNKDIFYSNEDGVFSKLKVPEIKPNIEKANKKGIRVLYRDKDSVLWAASNISLFEIENIGREFKTLPIKIADNKTSKRKYLPKITAMHQSLNGTFWIGTQQQGLKKSISSGNPKNQSFTSYLIGERISSFLEDKKDRLWIGTYKGLKLYRPQTDDFIVYTKTQGDANTLSSDIIICMYEDTKGSLWIGTPNGLNQVVEKNNGALDFKTFQEKDGLPNNYIHAIMEDNYGNLWMSTNKGISKYNITDNSFLNYDVNSGLQSNTFMENVSLKDTNGTFYFGGIYGINIFHPDSVKTRNVPPVIITGLKISGQDIIPGVKYNGRNILNKAIEYNPDITLTHNDNTVSIEYSALDFRSNSGYSYEHKMEGLDNEWNASNTQKNITYSNLKAGNYTFKVKTTNNEKNTNSEVASLNIKVLPPFWKTWQAFLIYIIAFIGLLYLYKYFITQQNELKTKLEISRLNRKKEEELIQIKTRFFTDIAHEFRTPLSLISGPVELMMDDKINEKQKKGHLSTIYYHTQRLLNLVNQLLDFRKIESGKMQLQVAKRDFKEFAHEIFLSFQELAESKNIKFKFEVKDANIPLTFDENRMEIVLCNLLSNAFKYSSNNSKITLSVKNIDSEKSSGFPLGYCQISVKDNGRGISKSNINQIFDRFYQIKSTNSVNLKGTGIGLELAKNIIELHKGNIHVKSKVGKGSEFVIRLPIGENHLSKEEYISDFKKADDPVHYKVERVLQDGKNIKIEDNNLYTLLIVEDNSEIRSFIKKIFFNTYTIIEAENGKVGLEKAIKHLPDLIISDLMMPEMDGLALCKHLREASETLHIPIIILTARTKTVFQEEGYSSGADIYVTKPFNPTILKAQAEGLLNNRLKLKDYFSKKVTLQPTDIEITSFDEQYLNSAMKIVEENLINDNLNRDFLAEKMATSPSTLYRKIKTLTGQDTTVFIRSIRLKRAAQMIQKKQDNVSSIGYSVGFNDLKYFRKCFKNQFGVTPSQFSKTTEV